MATSLLLWFHDGPGRSAEEAPNHPPFTDQETEAPGSSCRNSWLPRPGAFGSEAAFSLKSWHEGGGRKDGAAELLTSRSLRMTLALPLPHRVTQASSLTFLCLRFAHLKKQGNDWQLSYGCCKLIGVQMLLRILRQVGFGDVRNDDSTNSYGDMIAFIYFLASHGWLSSSRAAYKFGAGTGSGRVLGWESRALAWKQASNHPQVFPGCIVCADALKVSLTQWPHGATAKGEHLGHRGSAQLVGCWSHSSPLFFLNLSSHLYNMMHQKINLTEFL